MEKHILVVDDQQSMLEIIKLVLDIEDYQVTCVTDSKAMRASIRKQLPNLIILDIYLHQEFGGDIAKRLNKEESTKNIPIILISADEHIKEVTKSYGADDYIAKPFDIQDLLDKVGYLLSRGNKK